MRQHGATAIVCYRDGWRGTLSSKKALFSTCEKRALQPLRASPFCPYPQKWRNRFVWQVSWLAHSPFSSVFPASFASDLSAKKTSVLTVAGTAVDLHHFPFSMACAITKTSSYVVRFHCSGRYTVVQEKCGYKRSPSCQKPVSRVILRTATIASVLSGP